MFVEKGKKVFVYSPVSQLKKGMGAQVKDIGFGLAFSCAFHKRFKI